MYALCGTLVGLPLGARAAPAPPDLPPSAASDPVAAKPDPPPPAADEAGPGAAPAGSGEPIEVVVTSSRFSEQAGRASSATEVIDRAEIEQSGARDAAELLEERPGIQIVRSFRGSELQLRGLDPEYTLILVDGDRVTGQIGGAIDLARYGVEGIERIEIVRGPGSALYGADAVGGVVNIISRDSRRRFEADAQGSYGMYEQLDLSGRVAGRPVAPLRLQLTGGLRRAAATETEGELGTTLSAREQWSTGGSAAYAPDSHHRFRLRGDYIRTELLGVDPGAGGALFDRTQRQEQAKVALEHRLFGSERLELVSRLSFSSFREQYLLDQRGGDRLDDYEDNRELLGQLTSLLRVTESDHHRSVIGIEQLFSRLRSERLAERGRRYRLAGFGQHAWTVYRDGARELELVPGLRVDADSQFGEQVSPKLALRYRVHPNVELRASYGRGFRAPSFQELLLRFENPSANYVVIGNSKLGAETSHGVDAAVRVFDGETYELTLTGFRNDLRDMIAIVSTRDDAGGLQLTYDNLERAYTMGLELGAAFQLGASSFAGMSYTLTDTWDGENDRALEGRAPHRLTTNLRLASPALGLSFGLRAALSIGGVYYETDPDDEDVINRVDAHAFAQVDLRLSKQLGRHLELFTGVDNLLDAGDRYRSLRPFSVYAGARGSY